MFHPRRPWILAILLTAGGCAAPSVPQTEVRTVEPRDLAGAETPGVSADQVVGPVMIETETVEVARGDAEVSETAERIVSPDGVDETRLFVDETVATGVAYPVEGLVGQINGRPVYADEFLLPLEDRLLRIVAELPLAQAVRDMNSLIALRFDEYVNSELIIAEAESRLTAEQQQGVLAWLRNVREETITNRGGTRDAAAESIEDEFGVSIDEFMEQRRSFALAQDLLRKRVQPRAIVSWRDVVQAYRRQFAEFNPPTVALLGRVQLHRERDANRIAAVEEAMAAGADFATIAELAGVAGGGAWERIELPADGLEGTTLSAPVRSRLDIRNPGSVGEPLDQGVFRTWFTVLSIDQPPVRSLYDSEVQRKLEEQLSSTRLAQEQELYIRSLRDRWVTENLQEMFVRLTTIARLRYLNR